MSSGTASPTPRAGTVEVLVGLLAEVDEATESGVFYDRVCRAVCALTSMDRAALLLHDATYGAVVPAGSYGVERDLLDRVEGNLDETPIARQALDEDRVVEASGDLADQIPPRYAAIADTETITCTPVAAAGRWLGVIFADRAGADFALDGNERETMMTLGRLAALTASVEHSTEQRERERQLADRVALTRELHERVIQRLFGVCLVLGADKEDLSGEELRRCHEELRAVVGELRRALARPVTEPKEGRQAKLAQVLERQGDRRPELRVEWQEGVEVPAELEPLTQSILAEALRNVDRHAEAGRVDVRVGSSGETFDLEVENDGLRGRATPGGGLGLRLAVLEALHHEGLVEFGPSGEQRWRVRLVVPLKS